MSVERFNRGQIAGQVAGVTGGTLITLAAINQGAEIAERGVRYGRAAYNLGRGAVDLYNQHYPATPQSQGRERDRDRQVERTPPRDRPQRPVARSIMDNRMDVDDKIANQGDNPAITATASAEGGGGGAYGLKGSGNAGLEYIPGHQEDDLRQVMTLKTSNTFRAYYGQESNTNPTLTYMKNGVQTAYDAGKTGEQVTNISAILMQVTTPWKYIPNNRLDLYCTPGQMSRFINAGYTGYRVKRCGFKLYGVYNMQNYLYSNTTLQGADTAYCVVMEPKNKFYKNQTPVNHSFDGQINPNPQQAGFRYGDIHENEFWRSNTTGLTNDLVACKLNIPTSKLTVPSTDGEMSKIYMDATRHEAQVLVRNGQNYEWEWTNPDSRFINVYQHNFSKAQLDLPGANPAPEYGAYDFVQSRDGGVTRAGGQNHRLRRNWPMQVLDDAYRKVNAGFWADCETGILVDEGQDPSLPTSWKNQALHYPGPSNHAMIPPVLIKIPNLAQKGSEEMKHNVWMYIDYNIEIEFTRGNYTQIYNAPDGVVHGGNEDVKFYGGISDFGAKNGYTQQAELTGEGFGHNFVSDRTDTTLPCNYFGNGAVERTTLDRAIPPQQQIGNAWPVAWDYTGYIPGAEPPPLIIPADNDAAAKDAKKPKTTKDK